MKNAKLYKRRFLASASQDQAIFLLVTRGAKSTGWPYTATKPLGDAVLPFQAGSAWASCQASAEEAHRSVDDSDVGQHSYIMNP
jgi:hypothetical protein